MLEGIKQKTDARSFLGHINNIYEAIQFTVDSENENGELPFLDCLIMRNPDGTPYTTVYRKPTNTGRYLNFHSCHSSATKQGSQGCVGKKRYNFSQIFGPELQRVFR